LAPLLNLPICRHPPFLPTGKSTLLNALTGAGVLAEDRLFATLDPTTRRAALHGGRNALFSDTVGFIQKLPTQLVAAFRATLEEVKEASLLVHVVDVSHPQAAAQVDAVNKVLAELGAANVPTLTAWNKLDACADGAAVRAVAARRDGTVAVSARTGEGLEELLAAVAARLADVMVRLTALVPYAQGELVEEAHRCGVVEACEFVGAGTLVRCRVPPALAARLRPLEVDAEWGVAEDGAAVVSEEEDYESWSDWEEAEAEEAEAAAAGGAERP
jgi:GTP-binding protein HflX